MFRRLLLFILSLLIVVLVASTFVACGEDGDNGGTSPTAGTAAQPATTAADDDLPHWLQQLIAGIEAGPVWNPPARITSYEYRGGRVYFVPADCCDKLSTLYDEKGEVICSPDGGIEGAGDGRCPDFFDMREDGKVVWEDSRS